MADDSEDGAKSAASRDATAESAALAGASRAKADAYLDVQMGLSQLQRDSLIEQNAFELSHLRWRRFNDQMKGALQIMLVMIGLLVVIGIGAAVWNASQADGLVVDSFSVPPSFAAAGISGDVVADDMTNKITAVHDFANDNSLARSKDVRQDSDQDIKVEIPETGISFAQAWRYLRQWLGHEQHLRGNIRALANGQIALTVSLGSADSFTWTGAPADLDKLEQQAAERVFATVDPVNIVLYMAGKDRMAEALAAAARDIAVSTGNVDVAEAYALHANMARYITGDVKRSLAEGRLALSLDPRAAPPHMETLNSARMLGYDEEVLRQARAIPQLKKKDNVGAWRSPSSVGFAYVQQLGTIWRERETGDFVELSTQACLYSCARGDTALLNAEAFALMHDAAGAARVIAAAQLANLSLGGADDSLDPADLARIHYFTDIARGDWRAAAGEAQRYVDAFKSQTGVGAQYVALMASTQAVPLRAYALAATGDFAGAHAAIDATPRDCYLCLVTRAKIDALQKNWDGAARWFADAAKRAPSIPFAYADWGRMLMAKGDLDGAIAKFTLANQKGPHFADPLEMWGEALIHKNRSDLALAKFEEADKYAPKWGRLHLKWGEALLWSGDRAGAQKQFAIAAHLDLTSSEKSERARVMHG
jgi:tetratricopeptide (TPR) repeat protein